MAQNNPKAADKMFDTLRITFPKLAKFPQMGKEPPELAVYLRSFPMKSYLIFYRPIDEGIEIVDTNILFSALLNSQSSFANLLFQGEYSYFICELVLVELFKRKEKIIKVSQLSENEIVRIYQILLQD